MIKLVSGDQRLSKDTADTLSLVLGGTSSDEDITILTPRSTPRVLDNESFIETNLLVTNSQDSVIKFSTTVLSDDTRTVHLEGVLIGFNEDRDGSVDEGSLELISGVGSDETVTTSNLDSLGALEIALAISSSVGIVRFEFKTVLGSIFDSEIRPATVATFVLVSVAINDLLFRERKELSVVDEVEAFEDTGSGERPARAALALILDGGNSTLVSPIDGVREVSDGGADGVGSNPLSVRFEETTSSVFGLEFSSG